MTYSLRDPEEPESSVKRTAGPRASEEAPSTAGVEWLDEEVPKPSRLRQLLLGQWRHEHETALFLLVSVLDFGCTYALLMTQPANGQRAVEANPIAAWFLHHYGFVKGLLGFKLGLVLFVCTVSQLVSMEKSKWGQRLLLGGTLLTGAVVGYSLGLLFHLI